MVLRFFNPTYKQTACCFVAIRNTRNDILYLQLEKKRFNKRPLRLHKLLQRIRQAIKGRLVKTADDYLSTAGHVVILVHHSED